MVNFTSKYLHMTLATEKSSVMRQSPSEKNKQVSHCHRKYIGHNEVYSTTALLGNVEPTPAKCFIFLSLQIILPWLSSGDIYSKLQETELYFKVPAYDMTLATEKSSVMRQSPSEKNKQVSHCHRKYIILLLPHTKFLKMIIIWKRASKWGFVLYPKYLNQLF